MDRVFNNMFRKSRSVGLGLALLLSVFNSAAQDMTFDTIKPLSEVVVRAFGQKRNLATGLISVVGNTSLSNKMSLLSEINTIPGMRMEERSPGSYRINIRGSSLRSPFGVRNVKVYWNGIPLTDPGGNTYFNQLAYNNFSSIEVFKGPASSMYGVGTGGLLLIENAISPHTEASVEYIGGSYGLHSVLATGNIAGDKFSTKLTYAHNESKGYREQSAVQRDNLSWMGRWYISEKQALTAALLYTDMYYQTPGALTLQEYQKNPRAARPAAGIFPSAVEAKAAIWQKNLTGGITYVHHFAQNITNQTTVYGSHNHIKNSAVRNYERRIEPHFGGRTQFTFEAPLASDNRLRVDAGAEWQKGDYSIRVNGNNKGVPDTLQTDDEVSTTIYSLFAQVVYTTMSNWTYTLGASYNKAKVGFTRLNVEPVLQQPFAFSNEVAPRISISKKWDNRLTILGSVAKGYASPTIAELLPSTGIINTALKAEEGWNYELTAEKYFWNELRLQATGFYFDMKNGLVQQRDESGADYFVNAGQIRQRGVELFADYVLRQERWKWLNRAVFTAGYTYSYFKYGTFLKEGNDYSGKQLPGVPRSSVTLAADMAMANRFSLNATYYGASKIFVNDANTAVANPYHLLGVKLGYQLVIDKLNIKLYLGGDNLLNENYSLGNDINGAGGRYYNAAPRRNMYVGAAISYRK